MAKQIIVQTGDGRTVTWDDTKYEIQDSEDKLTALDREDGSITTIMKKWIVLIHEETR